MLLAFGHGFVGAVVSMSTPFNRKIVFHTDTSPLADYPLPVRRDDTFGSLPVAGLKSSTRAAMITAHFQTRLFLLVRSLLRTKAIRF